MNSDITPLPILPIVEQLFGYAAHHHDKTGITGKELHAIQQALIEGYRPIASARGQICSDRYEFNGVYLYIHPDFVSLSKGEVLICASLKKELLYIRAPQKHETFDIVTDTVIHSEHL